MASFLSLLTALIALAGAFLIFHYKQLWQKKHDHYEAIMSVVGEIYLDTTSHLSDLYTLAMWADEGRTDIKSILDTSEKLKSLNSKLPMAGVFISEEAAHMLYKFVNVNVYENYRIEVHYMDEGHMNPKNFRQTKLDRHNEVLLQSSNLITSMTRIIQSDLKIKNNIIIPFTLSKKDRS
ncbi:hypothetical protein [Kushneria sp. EE4]